jgi:hypothetical protein
MRMVVLCLALALLAAGPAAAFGDCRSAGYIRVFDERLDDGRGYGPERCVELARFEIPHGGRRTKMRVLGVVGDARDSDATWIAHVGALAERLASPMEAMGPLDLPEVSVLLTSLTLESDDEDGGISRTHAAAWSPHENECFVTFYKLDEPVARDEFVFTYAHELFHCMQQKTFGPEATMAAHQDWWAEGSAEYFANLVQIGAPYSDEYYRDFSEKSTRVSLFEMDYENVVFFLWLGQERGPAGVRALIGDLARGGGSSAHLATMRRDVPIEAWTAFGESFMDREIRQPGGREVGRTATMTGEFAISGARRVPLASGPYTLARYTLNFAEGKVYKTAVDGPSSIRIRMAERENEWADPPPRVLACDEDKRYRALVLTTDDERATALRIDDPEELDQRACCLIGEWRPTPESLQGYVREALEHGGPAIGAAGGSLSCSYVRGDWTLWFAADGKGGVRWNDITNQCVVTGKDGSMSHTTTRFGAHKFEWDVVDRGVGRWKSDGADVAWRYVMEIGPMRQERTLPESGPSVESGGFAYQCTDRTLNIKGVYGLSHREYDHLRSAPGVP